MLRAVTLLPLCAILGAFAGTASADPLEQPVANQSAVLAYEVEVTGAQGGRTVHDRMSVRTPMFARESGAMNPLGDDFTESQQAEMAEMSAATIGDGDDGEAAILEASRLMDAMVAACAADERSGACVAARDRVLAAERRIADHGATVAAAQAQVRRRDEDDHRFLIYMAGDGPSAAPATVDASYNHGGRTGALHFPTADGLGEFFSAGDMVVLDRRDGSMYLAVQWGQLMNGVHFVDVEPLIGAPGVKRVGLPFSSAVTLAGPQPTAGPDGEYAGAKVIQAGGLRYEIRWRLLRD